LFKAKKILSANRAKIFLPRINADDADKRQLILTRVIRVNPRLIFLNLYRNFQMYFSFSVSKNSTGNSFKIPANSSSKILCRFNHIRRRFLAFARITR